MVKPNSSKSFDERCYDLLLKIPKGKVTTYREMAEALGCQAYRAVGGAMNRNPKLVMIPCHRVVKSNGYLGGYASGKSRKLELLKQEGVDVSESGHIDLSKFLYSFSD
jgi:methylated-DNA-[protein]-cysteine S-methyltransferase